MKKLAFLLIPTLLFSCTEKSNTALTDEQKKKIYEEVQPVFSQLFEAAAKADSTQLFDIFEPAADFRYIGTEGEMLDYTSFKQMVSLFYGTIRTEMIEKGTQQITYIDSNSVLWTNNSSVTVVYKNGWKLSYNPFVITLLLKKTASQWKAIFIQESGKLATNADTTRSK